MTPKEHFDGCLALAQFAASRHDERRRTEVRGSLACWGLLVACIGYLKREPRSPVVGVAGLFFFVAYAFFWLRGVWVANTDNMKLSYHYSDQAQLCLRDDDHVPQPGPARIEEGSKEWWFGFISNWSMSFQLLLTFLLVLILYWTEPMMVSGALK